MGVLSFSLLYIDPQQSGYMKYSNFLTGTDGDYLTHTNFKGI